MKKYIIILIIMVIALFSINCDAQENNYVWQKLDGYTYYLDPQTGTAKIGLQEIEGEKYYFNEKGQLQHLLTKIEDTYYFFGRYSGKMQYGWLPSEGKIYYLDPKTGVAASGKVKIDGYNYYFNEKGQMQVGPE